MPRRFTDVEDEQLIETIRNYPALYDHGHHDFKNGQIKDGMWKIVASTVGRDVIRCKKRWKDIRDNYFKIERKNKNGSATKLRNPKWPLFELLSFLQTVKQERRSHNRPESEEGQSEVSDVEILRITCPRVESHQSRESPEAQEQSRPESPISSVSSSRKRKHKPFCLREMRDIANSRAHVMDKSPSKQPEEDEVDIFMKSMAMTIKKLPPPLIAQAKMSILSIITQLQFPTSSIPFTASFSPLSIPALLTNIPPSTVNVSSGPSQPFSPTN